MTNYYEALLNNFLFAKNFIPIDELFKLFNYGINYYFGFILEKAGAAVEAKFKFLDNDSLPNLFLTLTLLSLGFY